MELNGTHADVYQHFLSSYNSAGSVQTMLPHTKPEGCVVIQKFFLTINPEGYIQIYIISKFSTNFSAK
jgi:hypothetical protein